MVPSYSRTGVPDQWISPQIRRDTGRWSLRGDKIHAGLLFTVKKKFIKESYNRGQISVLWEQWRGRHDRMKVALNTGVWNPHPSGLCYRHCVVSECIYNGANR